MMDEKKPYFVGPDTPLEISENLRYVFDLKASNDALLRVARVVKAWINLYNDGPLPNFASWREAEKEIEAALKEVEHLL